MKINFMNGMISKLGVACIGFILSSSLLFGQKITVLSAEDLQPIPYAQVRIIQLQSKAEKILITDENAIVHMNDSMHSFTPVVLTVSFLGFKSLTDTLKDNKDKIYYLKPESNALNEVVITAQYAPNSAEKAVHKIKIIDSKKIEAMAAVNLKDVLSNELNIRISQDNILGSSMSLQGISGQNVKLLIDGIPVTGRLNGNIDISQINMNNVERIEIIEGPLSVSYGTDALGGTINIVTKKTQKKTWSIVSNNYYESSGQYNNTGKLGFQKGNKLISISGGRNYFDGWRSDEKPFHIEEVRIADSLRVKDWKPKEQFFGTLYYGQYLKKLKLSYTGDYFNEQVSNRGLPRLPYFENAFDDYYTTNRINNSLSLSGPVNASYHLNLVAAYTMFTRVKNTYLNDLTLLEEQISENPGDHDTSVFNNLFLRGTFSKAKDTSLVNYEVGYDINNETALGARIKEKKQTIGDYAIFSTAEIKPLENFIIRPGVRAIYNTAYMAPLVPSLNLKYTLKQRKNNCQTASFRFSYARGFRAPSLKELYFYFVDINHNITGNENLKAEHSHNFNFTGSLGHTKGEKIYKTELSVFYNSISDMIALAQSGTTLYSYFNIDKFKTWGIQLQNEFTINHLKFTLGGEYIGRYNQLADSLDATTFSYSPEGRCNVMYEWHKQQLTFSLFYKYTGKLPSFAVNAGNEVYRNTIQDFHTADCSVSKQLWKKRIAITTGVKNIFDVRNITGSTPGAAHAAESTSIAVAMGRIYFIKFDINLNSR